MANSNTPFSRDAYDDLADLFLTDTAEAIPHHDPMDDPSPLPFPSRGAERSARPSASSPSMRSGPRISAVMRVNLPVIAGPWLEQAASAIASESGPVALLRVRGEKTTMDLIAGREGQEAAAAASMHPADGLAAAVQLLRRVIACWIVEAEPVNEALQTQWEGIDEVIILTGADEAAIVAAFAQLKAIKASVDRLPRLGLIVVGSEDQTARRAAARISSTCAESLGLHVELRAVIQRMQPVPMRHLGRFARTRGLAATIAEALGQVRTEPETPTRPRVIPDAVAAAGAVDEVSTHVSLRPKCAPPTQRLAPNSAPADPVTETPASPQPVQPAHRSTTSTLESADSGHGASEPVVAATPGRASLVGLLQTLQPLEVDCPRAPEVELGFDRHGGLHVLVEDESELSLQRLFIACDWVREHLQLLRRVNPWLGSTGVSSASTVTPHLFTSRPSQRRHLADGPLRIHILVRDPHQAERIVTHIDLN